MFRRRNKFIMSINGWGGTGSDFLVDDITKNSEGTMEDNKIVNIACFCCGKLVQVMLPFYGCVYCSDCISNDKFSATTERFYRTPNPED